MFRSAFAVFVQRAPPLPYFVVLWIASVQPKKPLQEPQI